MDKPYGVIVLGVRGSGRITLGRAPARVSNFRRLDQKHYAFAKSEIIGREAAR